MFWRLVLFALLAAWSALVAARHGSASLDPSRATPGIRLELVEIPSTTPSDVKKYRLRVEGLPSDATYDVWIKDYGQQFKQVLSGFRSNKAGELVSIDDSGRGQRFDEITLDPGPYPNGAVWMAAIASEDHKLSAYAKVIPHPITARDGTCAVSLELVSLHGNRFLATGSGFPPGAEVTIEQRYAGRTTNRQQRVSVDGHLPPDVVLHGGVGTDLTAEYAVNSSSCRPVVPYVWGIAALKRR
jgi:hypothetical protein